MTLSPEFKYATKINSVLPALHDDVVWHYTDASAVLGILETGSIWASSLVMTNDPDDLIHGLNFIQAEWKSKKAQHPHKNLIEEWVTGAAAKIEAFERADSYIVCGSTMGDSHPQFLLYGPYAVGINGAMALQKVERSEAPDTPRQSSGRFDTGWRRVLYSNAEKANHVEQLLRALTSLADEASLAESQTDPDVYQAAIECVIRSSAYMKHRSFQHEREVRLYGRAALTNSQVRLRSGKYGVSPYVEVRLDEAAPNRGGNFPLQRINLGPGLPQPAAAMAGLRIALDETGYEKVKITDLSDGRRT